MVPGSPWRAKDFTLIQHDGLYHLFYIRHNYQLPTIETEKDLGHAVSADLWNWTQLPPVLAVRDSAWDSNHVWAPSIVEKDGVFYMFYTGVTDQWQRIGVATSTDLMEWTRYDAPVLSCRATPFFNDTATTENTGFRDPFVMPDPAHPGRWLMYYAACLLADPASMVTGVAESEDLFHWTDRGLLWSTFRQSTGSWILESPHLFEHQGLWYLLFTSNLTDSPLRYMTGPDPVGDVGSWTQRGSLGAMLGVNASSWYASEFFSEGLVDYLAYVIADRIDVKRIVWQPDGRFVLVQPDLMHVKSMAWDLPRVDEESAATLSIVAVNPLAGTAAIEALRVRADGSESPLPLDSLGLPAQITLTGDTTRFAWNAGWMPDPADTTRTMRMRVRLVDRTGSAGPIDVVPLTLEVGPLAWDRDTVADDSLVTLSIPAVHWRNRSIGLRAFRVLRDGTPVPVPPGAVSLPAAVPLTGDTTRVRWTARWISAPPDSGDPLRLRVERDDGVAVAPDLVVLPPPPLEVSAMAWDRDTVAIGGTAHLAVAARHWEGRSATLACVRVRGDGTREAIPPDSLGIPAALPLAADTTVLAWVARWRRDGPDTTGALRLEVAAAEGGAAAPLLVVPAPAPLEVLAIAWDRDSVEDGTAARLEIAARNAAGRAVWLETWRLRADSTLVPAAPESLGFDPAVPLAGDTTRVTWTARWRPDGADTSSALRLVLRAVEGGREAAALTVPKPPPMAILALAWNRDTVASDSLARLAIVARRWTGRSAALEALRARDSSWTPVPADSIGFPAVVPLVADTTFVAWTARWRPDPPDTTGPMRVRVQAADGSAAALPLVVLPPPPLVLRAMAWDSVLVREGSLVALRIEADHWAGRSVRLAAWRVVDDTTEVPLEPAALGLPGEVALTGAETALPWRAAWLPDGADSSRALFLRVRTADSALAAAPLIVAAGHQATAGVPGGTPAVTDALRLRFDGAGWALAVSLARTREVRLDLYDLQGRHVRRLLERSLPAGTTVVRWDGRDDRGAPAGAGVYLARLASPGFAATSRLVLLR